MKISGGFDRWSRRWVVKVVDDWGRIRSTDYAIDRAGLNELLKALRRRHGWRIATSSRWLDMNRGGTV